MDKVNIQVIIGSTRPNRFSEHPARWIFELLKAKEGVNAELLDLRDYPMQFFNEPVSPSYREGKPADPAAVKWEEKITAADGFIVVTPEYNRGTSAVLKNAFDQTYYAWNQKAVAFVSYGTVGGARAVEQLRLTAIELQMAPIRSAVHIHAPWDLLENGKLKAGALLPFTQSAETFLNQLLWWTRALKAARNSG